MKKMFLTLFLLSAFIPCAGWMHQAIEQEFSGFAEEGISRKKLEQTWNHFSKTKDPQRSRQSFKRYKVIKSKVYGPKTALKNLLQVLVKKYAVPDVDFIYCHEDIIPLTDREKSEKYVPIFCSAKDRGNSQVILFVDSYYDIKALDSGWNGLIQIVNNNQHQWDWSKKLEKLVWRGSANDGFYTWDNWKNLPRGRAVYLSRHVCPEHIDAGFTGFWQRKESDGWLLDRFAGTSPNLSPPEQMCYKYLLDVDGVTCTFTSLSWKLLTGSVVLKQITSDIMWYYPNLIPWEHYIPVQKDLGDLVEKVIWAKTHDTEARLIAENGRRFALENLMPEHILLYCYMTLLKYASLQKFQPEVD